MGNNVNDLYNQSVDNLKKQKTSAISQLYNAKQNALKYADTTAQAQGYASQGAMLDNVNNINSLYQNNVGSVENAYAQQLGNIELQRQQQANQNSDLSQVSYDILNDKLVNSSVESDPNDLKSLYYYNNLNDAQKMQFDYDVERYGDALKTYKDLAKQFEGQTPIASVEELRKATGQTLKKLLGGGAGIGKNRLANLQEVLNSSDLANGDTFKIKDLYFTYFNGQLYSIGKTDKVTYNIKNKD